MAALRPLPALLVTALLAAGCASPLPPAAELPEPPVQFLRQAGQEPVDARWWQRFADPTLIALLTQLDAGNLELRQALTRVELARAGAAAQASRGLPILNLSASASDARSDLPEAVKQRGQADARALRAGLELQWEIDLFGAARAARRAADFDAEAAVAGLAGARLLLQTEVASHYLQWQSARQRSAQLQALVVVQAEQLALLERRRAEGLTGEAERRGAVAELQALRAQQPALRLVQQHAEHRIALLLGRSASQPVAELASAPIALPAVPPLPPGQPAELLLRRPDLRAASARAGAERQRAEGAQAERWPRLLLGAVWGGQDLRLNGLDLAPAAFQNVALAFAAPLFNAGRLQAIAEAQAAAARGAELAQQQSWLTALAEVESALAALQASQDREALLAEQRDAREAQQRHAERLLAEGQSGRAPLLAARRGVWAAEIELSQARLASALDALQLSRAIAGGWQPETP
jgi:NodT family efflux transporter outer membrane factor (OMF) lipoprotein